ncbi:HD domain-containing protein [Marinobacterium sp. AK62]|uniref:HD domain-containing protein n=1 Tax=Marinobacterium alkalitolerans TaxID=1542925 RepID=A0ABS3ZEP9_9GAMM|nr:HD domain-containing phosphohydrolase [Marinobacterium alkalitolerans]MBP0050180.1 HD domain-containing protein [Marinobacterium alkalitolerans]
MAHLRKGWPLQSIFAAVIVVTTLLLSTVLITRAYLDQRELLLEAAESSSRQLASRLDSVNLSLLAPVENSLKILVHDTLLQADTLDERLQRLPLLVQVLESNPVTSAVYTGYPDRDFVLLREIQAGIATKRLNAPPGAAWMVQSIDHQPEGSVERLWLFYSKDLALLESREVPDYLFDPTSRPWFQQAQNKDAPRLTPPYVFFTTREVGVTLSHESPSTGAVVGIDASVQEISHQLRDLQTDTAHEMVVVDRFGTVVAWPQLDQMLIAEGQQIRLASLGELGVPALEKLMSVSRPDGKMVRFDERGETWFGLRQPLLTLQGESLQLLVTVPEHDLLAGINDRRVNYVYWALSVTLLALLLGTWVAYRMTRPLGHLSQWVAELARFDFSREGIKRTGIREVNELNRVLGGMANAIRHFKAISYTLAREQALDRMLPAVAEHLKASVGAEQSMIYLLDPDRNELKLASARTQEWKTALPASIQCESTDPKLIQAQLEAALPKGKEHWLVTALEGRESLPSGFMVLGMGNGNGKVRQTLVSFVNELSGSAATAIETRRLIEAQKRLLDAIVRLLADAIDAKSPHTSGHCERVPELAQMVLDAACNSREGEFAGFSMSDDQRYEFYLAAWLHDCGKITTPEYVLDKGTKLETLYDRIHEIRTRFEVLWRDAEIRYLKGLLEQGDGAVLRERLIADQERLQADFALVAKLNQGTESVSDEDVKALEQIAGYTWLRHFDKRQGVSDKELERMPPERDNLPVTEPLLADRPEHRVPWNGRRPPVEPHDPNNEWGFDMALPEYQENHGELYNLTQRYGTLTPEERFSINNHIVQTIRMLTSLPFPRHLQRVPEIAGNHHERVDGEGYPRRLNAGELSVPERIMALADVFEALTAADRPYKKAKTLSESLRILAFMARDGHLDPAVFKLFLDSEAYLAYAHRYLTPEQIDPVDKRQLWQLVRSG